jgi:hypothetical protein
MKRCSGRARTRCPRPRRRRGARRDLLLLHERAVGAEHLDPVVRRSHTYTRPSFDGSAQCTGFRNCWMSGASGIVGAEVRVVGLVAVGAPVALELARVHVDDGDALVARSRRRRTPRWRRVERDLGDAAEVLGAVAVGTACPGSRSARKRPSRVNLRMCESRPVAADPDVVHVVEREAVVRRGPVVALAGAAPGVHEVALGVELEDVRRGNAALAGRRVGGRADLGALVELSRRWMT